MVIDSSALLAIILDEPELGEFASIVAKADVVRFSAASYVEASYALAKTTREPLLFTGNDFSQTDLESAIKPLQ